jgi:chemotaxis protein MotA
MDMSLVIGLGFGFGSLVVAFIMEGGNPIKLIGPSALLMIIGGMTGALTISFGLAKVLKMPGSVVKSMKPTPHNGVKLVDLFIYYSEKARKEGLLSLEGDTEADASFDPLIKKGLSLVIDGTDANAIKEIFEIEILEFEEREKSEIAVFEQAGGFCPTMGIIGTVLGLVSVLSHLSEPELLGEKIATAFLATLYGISFANIIFLPIANKLKGILKEQMAEKNLILTGLIALQAGDNPRILKDKLMGFLSDHEREKVRSVD